MTRTGVDRVLKYAFELAVRRPRRKLTSATKSNGISVTMPYWDERVAAMAAAVPGGRRRQVPHRHPHGQLRPAPGLVRRRRRLQPLRRHPLRPRAGLRGHDRDRAERQHQSRAALPEPVRAGPRLGARHRRQGDREPDRPDLVRLDDARPPRPRGGRGGGAARDRAGARARAAEAPLTPDLGGSGTTVELGEEIAAEVARGAAAAAGATGAERARRALSDARRRPRRRDRPRAAGAAARRRAAAGRRAGAPRRTLAGAGRPPRRAARAQRRDRRLHRR